MTKKKRDEAPEKTGPKNYKNAGIAAGIGSAAIVAALLYAKRRRKDKKD